MKAVILLALIVVAAAAVPSRPKAVNRINAANIPFSNGPRFVGGEDAGEREFPFVVSIQVPVQGAIDLRDLPDDVQLIQASETMIHESYDDPAFDYNIGIITLSEPLIFRQNVQPIRLAIPTIEASGEVQVVAYEVADGNIFPVKQKKLSLNVIERDVCKRDFSRIVDITENMICASAPGRSTCSGDWGGVLIAKDEARRPYLAGHVNFMLDPCAVE
ncbi:unnamed protein product, partial [Allacma fusca]